MIWKVRFWRRYITRETQRVCRLLWFVRVERTRALLHRYSFWISEEGWVSSSTMLLPPPEGCRRRRSESGEPKPSALATLLVLHFSPLIPLSLGSLSLSFSSKIDFSFKHFTRFELTWSRVFSVLMYFWATDRNSVRSDCWIVLSSYVKLI